MNVQFIVYLFVPLLLFSDVRCIGYLYPMAAVTVSGLYAGWDYIKGFAYETCNSRHETRESRIWIRSDRDAFAKLEESLRRNLYGQPLAKNLLTKAVKSHLLDDEPVKALVLSLHGWTGSGKNHVSQLIAAGIFKLGGKSTFVHHLSGTHLFPESDKITAYKEYLKTYIEKAVRNCPRQLFVLDEVDKMPPGLLDILAPFLDYHPQVNGVDYRKSIFLFLSNTGGNEIARVAHQFWLDGKERNDIRMKDIEPLVNSGAFNERGGFHKSDIISSNLIDFYVPFLPLEKKHIKLCARDYMTAKYPDLIATDEILEKVAMEMEYFPPDTHLYSKTGCKRVQKKVDVLLID
ncbi:Torsin-1B [Halotydeus destructor]|nr:Torsin-1B [Halotydeus destructor]